MISGPDRATLVIFCKRPMIGTGKQRVAAELGTAAALQLSSLLLNATLADASEWPGPVVIAPAEPADREWATELMPGTTVIPQRGRNLGERVNYVDARLRAAGHRNILFVGTDAPGLSIETLLQAAQRLADHDVVTVPARDGGVTLLGSREPWPLLADLAWETERLGAELCKLCERQGLSTSALPTGFDIDHYADLRAVRDALRDDSRATRQALALWAEQPQSISIVVPVMRDQTALARLLDRLTPALSGNDEILVVDADAAEGCAQACATYGARYLNKNASRGSRMNFGAMEARNNILWFLHADAEPDSKALEMIRQALRSDAHGGYFRFRFSGTRSLPKRVLEGAINLRTAIGIPYADQALFMTRAAYEQAGGFADAPLFEEVTLVKALQRTNRFKRLGASTGVSPRRWERDGWLRRTLQNRLLVLGYWLGVPTAVLAKIYRGQATSGSAADNPKLTTRS